MDALAVLNAGALGLDLEDWRPGLRPRACTTVLGRTADGGYIRCDRGFWTGSNGNTCPEHAALNRKRHAAEARARRVAKRSERRREAREGLECGVCGWPLDAERSTARFCSPKCRQKAYRQRCKDR